MISNIKNYKMLMNLPNHKDGEIFYCEEEKEYYVYGKGAWNKTTIKVDGNGASLSLYELNKDIIKQLSPISKFDGKIAEINDFQLQTKNSKYLMYGKEIGYFTLFEFKDEDNIEFETLGDAVVCLLQEMGNVYSIDRVDGAMEIWIQSEGTDVTCLYLFPYDNGVVYYNG